MIEGRNQQLQRMQVWVRALGLHLFAVSILAAMVGCNSAKERRLSSTPSNRQTEVKESANKHPAVSSDKQPPRSSDISRTQSELADKFLSHYSAVAPPTFPEITAGKEDEFHFSKLAELSGHKAHITKIVVSPDAKLALSSDADATLIFWDLDKRVLLAKQDASDHGQITSFAISPDGSTALVAGQKGLLTKWNMRTGTRIGELEPPGEQFDAVAFTSDPRIAAAVNCKRGIEMDFIDTDEMTVLSATNILLSGYANRREDKTKADESPKPETRLQFLKDARQFVISDGKQYHFYGPPRVTATRKSVGSKSGRQFERRFDVLSQFPSDRIILDHLVMGDDEYFEVAYDDGVVASIPIAPDNIPKLPQTPVERARNNMYGRPTPVRALALFPGGRIVVAYGGGESIDMWGKEAIGGRLVGSTDGVSAVAVCPDGRRALSGYTDGRLTLYQLPRPIKKYDDRIYKSLEQARNALADGHFDELEKIGGELRKSHQIAQTGIPEYALYYTWLSEPKERTETEWAKLFKRLETWLSAKPNSTFARVALARAYSSYGWQARGGGYASEVTAEGMQLFSERLKQGTKYLLDALNQDADDPAVYDASLSVAQGMGVGKEELIQTYSAGIKADPKYYPLYMAMATSLLPRWYGEPGDLSAFLNDVLTQSKGDEGLVIYALIVGEIKHFHSLGELEDLGVDMGTVNKAAQVLLKRFPYSQRALNLACWCACVRRDRQTARDLFGWIGDIDNDFLWENQATFLRLRKWAMDSRHPAEEEKCILASANKLSGVAFSPDGKTIAVCGDEELRQVTLWDAGTGEPIGTLSHPESVSWVEFSPDGRQLATAGGSEKTAQLFIWQVGSKEIVRELEGPIGKLNCARFSPNRKWLAAGGDDDNVWIWQLDESQAEPTHIDLKERIVGLDFSQKSDLLALASEKKGAALVMASKQIVGEATANNTRYSDIRFMNNELFVCGGPFHLSRHPLDESASRNFELARPVASDLLIETMDLSPNGRLLAVGVNSISYSDFPAPSQILIFSTGTNKEVTRFHAHNDRTAAVRFSPDGKRLASVGWDGTLRLWITPNVPADHPHAGDQPPKSTKEASGN